MDVKLFCDRQDIVYYFFFFKGFPDDTLSTEIFYIAVNMQLHVVNRLRRYVRSGHVCISYILSCGVINFACVTNLAPPFTLQPFFKSLPFFLSLLHLFRYHLFHITAVFSFFFQFFPYLRVVIFHVSSWSNLNVTIAQL